jgi:putative sugar O-methyltransferase
MDKKLIEELNLSLRLVVDSKNKERNKNGYGDWEDRAYSELDKIIGPDDKILESKLERFIWDGVFVTDQPTTSVKGVSYNNKFFKFLLRVLILITGNKRSGVYESMDTFNEIKRQNMLPLLKKYPMSDVGQPFKIKHSGFVFTQRYLRHIYFFSFFKIHLLGLLKGNSITLDIGSSYGLFQMFVKKEMPSSHNILVDLPGQLILAHYYLSCEFPNAKIASIVTVNDASVIDEEFIRKYDFILIPTTMYEKLHTDAVDVVTNFVSLSEMSKKWFDVYFDSIAFKTAKYFYTVNRYDSFPTYSNGITVFDFPLNSYRKIIFNTLPILKSYYLPKAFFLTKKIRFPSEFFQFIGERKKITKK